MKDDHRGFVNGSGKGSSQPNSKGLTNGMGGGMTNGMGRTNGMTNGMGRTNGMTNGMSQDRNFNINPKITFTDKKPSWKKKVALAIITIALISMIFMVLVDDADVETVIMIDGQYDEWTNMTDIGFGSIGLKTFSNSVYMGLERPNILLGNGNVTEAYYIFINDKNSDEGFYLGYDTYEYYLDVYGVNNTIKGAVGYQFDADRNNSDWNGFYSRYNSYRLPSANNDNFIELKLSGIMLGRQDVENLSIVVYHFRHDQSYEYSQLLDVDTLTEQGSIEQVRNNKQTYYEHIFETNTLHINTERVLAYSSVPYDIREIIQRPTTTSETNTTVQPVITNETKPSNKPIEEYNRGCTLTIEYDFSSPDIIVECGGIIIESTRSIENVTLDETGFTLYGVNHTVVNCVLEGDFGYQKILDETTRSGNALSFSDIPVIPEPSYNASVDYKMTAFWTDEVPVIDGVVNETAWSGVGIYYVNETKSMTIYTSMDSENLYIAVISNNDTNPEANDYCAVFIDIGHNETTSPDTDDVMIARAYGGSVSHYVGNGAGWTYVALPDGVNCSSNASTTDSRVSWEFKIPVVYLNAYGNFNTTDSFVGFGVQIMDGTGYYHTTYPDYYVEGAIPPMYLMPDYWADLYDGSATDMGAFYTSSTPTIDGVISANEWDDADTYTVDLTKDMEIHTMRDDTYVYVAICVTDDTTNNLGDRGCLYFDCDHDATASPDANDKRLHNNSLTTYYEGDGSVWQSTTIPTGWVSYRGITNGYRTYEFQVPISDLNETGGFWQDGDEIGFGCAVYNAGSPTQKYWLWYPDNYYYGQFPPTQYNAKPDTWGDLVFDIPEFNDVVFITVGVIALNVIVFAKRRKDGDDDE